MSQVRDIIDGVKHRLPDRVNIYPALNRAVGLVSKRLFFHKASLVRGNLSVSVTADSSSASMPSDYWALLEKPYISGKTYVLRPVPDQEAKLSYTSNSTPIYYEVVGTTIYLYPGTSSAITIKGGYWTKPTALTKPSDTMPFNEMFDDVIQEALINVYMTGGTTGNPNDIGLLRELINQSVDLVAPYMEKAAPKRFEDSMGLDYYTNEDVL